MTSWENSVIFAAWYLYARRKTAFKAKLPNSSSDVKKIECFDHSRFHLKCIIEKYIKLKLFEKRLNEIHIHKKEKLNACSKDLSLA